MTTDSAAIRGIDITTYLIKDYDRAIAFWRDTMGLTIAMEYGGMGAEFELADGATFGLWKMDDGSWHPNNSVLFSVADVHAAVARYKERGVHFEGDGHIEETPGCFMAFAKDSEGNGFMLHQRKV